MAESLDDLTSACVRCGFCLESCPTFVLTGDETRGPRGRIRLARQAIWDQGAHEAFDSCLGCRACETACPSGVKYGQIIEQAKTLAPDPRRRARKSVVDAMANPRKLTVLAALSALWPGDKLPGFLGRRIAQGDPVVGKPRLPERKDWPPLDDAILPPVTRTAFVLDGCAMRVLFPDALEATRRLLRRLGFETAHVDLGCCGALHAHSGFLGEGKRMAGDLAAKASGTTPVVVPSAGCGSWLKEQPALQGRVFDVSEFLLVNGLPELLARSHGLPGATVTYHDACHLAHGQGIRSQPRELLNAVPGLKLVPLQESDMCCGSAGTYNAFQPGFARRLLDRKWGHATETKADYIVTGNPGCHSWLLQAWQESGSGPEPVMLPEILERSLEGRVDT